MPRRWHHTSPRERGKSREAGEKMKVIGLNCSARKTRNTYEILSYALRKIGETLKQNCYT